MANQLIDRDTIEDILQGKEFARLEKAIENEKEEPEKLAAASNYHQVIKKNSENVIVENTQNLDLGHCRLKIIVEEGLPKKVCFLRNGMLITDKLHGLIRFYNFKDFVAVFECLDEKGNALLREMEPPRHDDFEPERLSKEQQAKGKRALNKIKDWIRKMIRRHAQDPSEESSTLDELADFIGAESSESGDSKNEEMNPVGKIRITAQPVKRKTISAPFISESISQGAELDDQQGDGPTSTDGDGGSGDGKSDGGQGAGDGSGSGGGKENTTPVALENVRITSINSGRKSIFFTPKKSGMIRVRVFLAGADSDYPSSITYSNAGKIKNGSLILEAVANQRMSTEISIDNDTECAIKVVADEI